MTLYVSPEIKATHDRLYIHASQILPGDVMPLWEDDPVTVLTTARVNYDGKPYVELKTSDGLTSSLIPNEFCRIYRPHPEL